MRVSTSSAWSWASSCWAKVIRPRSSLLFAQDAGELLFGGLESLVALDVIQGAQLGQHRL